MNFLTKVFSDNRYQELYPQINSFSYLQYGSYTGTVNHKKKERGVFHLTLSPL